MSPISGNYQVTQTYTRHVEMADSKHAQKVGLGTLPSAPNQNIQAGTRGEFKSSASFFKESLKGFFDAPLGKKVAFLQDRVELRSIQKKEANAQEQVARLERRDAGATGGIKLLASDHPNAITMLNPGATKYDNYQSATSVTLTNWLGEAKQKAETNGTPLRREIAALADRVAQGVTDKTWKNIDLPALDRMADQFRSEGRHEKADLLNVLTSAIKGHVGQATANQKYLPEVREYITNFNKTTPEFWRNNDRGGETALKNLISHSFMNPYKAAVLDEFMPNARVSELKDIDAGRIKPKEMSEDQIRRLGAFALRLLDAMENVQVTTSMKVGMETLKSEIATLRPDKKDGFTEKLYMNAMFVKSVNTAMVELGHAAKLGAMMLYEAVLNTRSDTTSPWGRGVENLVAQIGNRGQELMHKAGLPRPGDNVVQPQVQGGNVQPQVQGGNVQPQQVDLGIQPQPVNVGNGGGQPPQLQVGGDDVRPVRKDSLLGLADFDWNTDEGAVSHTGPTGSLFENVTAEDLLQRAEKLLNNLSHTPTVENK